MNRGVGSPVKPRNTGSFHEFLPFWLKTSPTSQRIITAVPFFFRGFVRKIRGSSQPSSQNGTKDRRHDDSQSPESHGLATGGGRFSSDFCSPLFSFKTSSLHIPVPNRVNLVGEFGSLPTTVNVPCSEVVSDGVNVSVMVQP